MPRRTLFTSESVTEGHPDKMADQVSDSILDAILAADPNPANVRVACETLVTTGLVVVAGEIRTDAYVDMARIARDRVKEIGYDDGAMGFDGDACGVMISIDEQSPDIAQGVDEALEVRGGGAADEVATLGAGDQGMMFGYACDETDELMPLPIHLAHRMAERLTAVRKDGVLPYLRPDGKTQVTVAYEDGVPVALDTVVVSTQHDDDTGLDDIRPDIEEHVVRPLLPDGLDADDVRVIVNPTGKFVIGGPVGDAGLTGRKIIVDTYGGTAPHGGGAFSGKDATKVDRSGAYATRWVARNIVAAGLARRAQLQVAYAIGVAEPVSVHVMTSGTGAIPDRQIEALVREHFPLTPSEIIETLDLRRPIYRRTAAGGHFGRDEDDFTWERTDRARALRAAAGLGDEVGAATGA